MDGGHTMTALKFAQAGLQARLWLSRLGWSNGIAILLLMLGSCSWLLAVPHLKKELAAQHVALQNAQKSLSIAPLTPPVAPIPQAEQRLQQFYDMLGESRYAEQQVKTLFAVAAKHGLTLNQAEYKFLSDKNGRFQTYSVLLPVHGQYAAIRPFCEQVLLAIPFASLDEVDFKREAVSNPILEAKLRFTLHLDDIHPVNDTTTAPDGKQGAEQGTEP
jgi:hypothetical protein